VLQRAAELLVADLRELAGADVRDLNSLEIALEKVRELVRALRG
jgi:hypothetical protein